MSDPTNRPHAPEKPPVRDFALECIQLGPSTRIIALELDRQGVLFYQFRRNRPQSIHLTPSYAGQSVVLIDMVTAAALLHPVTHRLLAYAGFLSDGTRSFLFGRDWGKWVNDAGELFRTHDVPDLMRELRLPISLQDTKHLVAFDFLINPHDREHLTREVVTLVRDARMGYVLHLLFRYPSGEFQKARLSLHEANSHRLEYVYDLAEFPVKLPAPGRVPSGRSTTDRIEKLRQSQFTKLKRPAAAPDGAEGEAAPVTYSPALLGLPEDKRNHRAAAVEPARSQPVPDTLNLSTHSLLGVLSTEPDPDRRWRMIEPNLMLGRPERNYPLILNYPELIAERTRDWPPPRLKAAFGNQPGSVLIGIMEHWSLNQILAVAEDNAESQRIIEWVREHEIARLLKLDTKEEPTSAEAARRILRVDRNADARMIRKVWRTLLHTLNADLGRQEERAIHRRKDEIAKHLQVARDVLMRSSHP